MNAAAKMIHQSNVFNGHWMSMRLSKMQGLLLTLSSALLLTAMAIIYVTNEARFSLSELERLENQAHEYKLEFGQLLLEQAALSAPARIEMLASKKWGMQFPTGSAVSVLHVS